jgi:translation elongation factor P/translation initiation factor 5A
MISTGELKKGVAIELDGELWQILDYHHIKMGRGSAQVRITLRNIKRGQTVERSFQAGTKWPRASMEKRPVQFLYRDGDDHHFMDTDTYDQFVLTTDQLGETAQYLKDGMTLDRTSYQGETIGVELPVTWISGRRHGAGLRRRHPDRRAEAGHDRDRTRRPGADLRRDRGYDPDRHPDRRVPDARLTCGAMMSS